MAILKEHIPFYREIFKIPGIISEPILTFGFQDIIGENIPTEFRFKDLKRLITSKGIKNILTLDLFDVRADLRYDLNLPVPEFEHNKYNLVFDIGTLEHIFDTRQTIENCLRMIKKGGFYFVQTTVRGYFRHGLHVLSLIDI